MAEFLLVSALLPSFAIGLFVIARLQPSIGGSPGQVMSQYAPHVYAGFIVLAVVIAAAWTGLDAERLGLTAPSIFGSSRLGLAAVLPIGVFVAVALFFAELLAASADIRRSPSSRSRSTSGRGQAGAGSDDLAPALVAATRPNSASAVQSVRALVNQPLLFGLIAVVTAVGEEILFRGLFLGSLREAIPVAAALVLQAAMFGANHVSFGVRNIFTKALGGLSWGLLTIGFGTILAAALSHGFFQYLVFRRMRRQSEAS